MENYKVVTATAWYTISNFFLKGIGFITTPIFARVLTHEEFGDFYNFSAWLSIITIVATLSLISSLIRARFEYAEELDSFIGTNLMLGSGFAFLVDILMVTNVDFFCNVFVIDRLYLLIICIYILVIPAFEIFLTIQKFQYKYKLVALITVFTTLTSIFLSLFLIYTMQDKLMARIIGAYLPSFCVSLVIYVSYLYKIEYVKLSYIKYSLHIAIPYIFHLLSGTILSSADRTMITKYCGSKETALYSMAYNIALIVSLIWSSMNSAYSPWMAEKLNDKNYVAIKMSSYMYVGIFMAIVIALMLITPEILFILGGEKYLEARNVIPPVMVSYFFVFIYSMYVNIEQFEKKTLGMAIATCSTALLNVILNYFFLPLYGYLAAAYTTLICYFLLTVFHYYLVRKMQLSMVFDTRFVCLICAFVVFFSGAMIKLYEMMIIRYSIALCYTIVFITILVKYKGHVNSWLETIRKRGIKCSI